MFKLIVLLATVVTIILGAPQSKAIRPMLDGRIVGGTDADIADYPFTASILNSNSHICGGGIISTTWIVSAAHCFSGSVSLFSVRVGSSTRNSGGQVIAASRILIHASYSSSTIDYDIALVELTSPITHANAAVIALPSSGIGPDPGAITTITGWGAVSEGGALATVLQVVDVPVVSQSDCRDAYGSSSITDRMFCAGLLGEGGRDACQGDSGGPVVVDGLLTGLVSWGAGCARPNYPGVNTNVPNLRAWITGASGV